MANISDHPGQPTTAPKEEGKKKKKGGGKTVSSVYLVSLTELMVKTSCFEIFKCIFLFRQLCTLASLTLYVALCPTHTRSLAR